MPSLSREPRESGDPRGSYGSYDTAIAEHGAAIADGLQEDPRAAVPGCPGWDVAKLALHVGLVHAWVAAQVRSRSTAALDIRSVPRAPDLPARAPWLRAATAALLDALGESADDQPAGRWRDQVVDAAFWHRRMAHESAVHRYDADQAAGAVAVLDPALAADGVDEFLDLFIPLVAADPERRPPSGWLHLVRDDGPQRWSLGPDSDGIAVLRGEAIPDDPTGADVRVTGPAASLLLVCWGRQPPEPLATLGEPELLGSWRDVLGW